MYMCSVAKEIAGFMSARQITLKDVLWNITLAEVKLLDIYDHWNLYITNNILQDPLLLSGRDL
jgi:hypothetical protein